MHYVTRVVLAAVASVALAPTQLHAQCASGRQGKMSTGQLQRNQMQQYQMFQQQLVQLQQRTMLQTALQRQAQQNSLLLTLLNQQGNTTLTSQQLQTALQSALQQTQLLLTVLSQQNASGNASVLPSALQQQYATLSSLSQ